MIERKVAKRFLNKYVGVVRFDDGHNFYSKGTITEVTETSIVLEFNGSIQAISLDSIKNIREIEHGRI